MRLAEMIMLHADSETKRKSMFDNRMSWHVLLSVAAVLLLVVAFAGTGAAATNIGTVFLYQDISSDQLPGTTYTSTYSFGSSSIIIDSNGIVYPASDKFVEGTYSNGLYSLMVKKPTVTYNLIGTAHTNIYDPENSSGIPTIRSIPYNVGTYYQGDSLSLTVTPIQTLAPTSIASTVIYDSRGMEIARLTGPVNDIDLSYLSDSLQFGEYTITSVFNSDDFAIGTPQDMLVAQSYKFKVAKATVNISVSASEVLTNDYVRINIVGKPGETYLVTGFNDYFDLVEDGFYYTQPYQDGFAITLPNDGRAYATLAAKNLGNATLKISRFGSTEIEDKLQIRVNAGAATAFAEKDTYYIGEKVKLTGSVIGGSMDGSLYIKGIDYSEKLVDPNFRPVVSGGEWEAEINTDILGITKSGRYLFVIDRVRGENLTALVKFRTPEIKLTGITTTVAQGSPYKFTGIAEGTTSILYYLVGENYFASGESIVDEDVFTIKLDESSTAGLSLGQYHLFIQHPMYNWIFDVYANGYNFYKVTPPDLQPIPLVNVYDRNKEDRLGILNEIMQRQVIDDIYVNTTFNVISQSSITIILDQTSAAVSKGSLLTVSGQTNLGVDETITVEMLETELADIPKEYADRDKFISVTTKTDVNGRFEAAIDTSGLAATTYTLTAFVGQNANATADITITEGGVVPDDPSSTLTSISLSSGWNFISVPMYLDSSCNTAGKLFANIKTAGNAILGYDNAKATEADDSWYILSNDTRIEPLYGYWIYSEEPATITLKYLNNVQMTPPVRTLTAGWNAVGLSNTEPMSARSTFAGLSWMRYIPWNLNDHMWGKTLIKGGSYSNSEENLVGLLNGGWLYIEKDGIFIGNTGGAV